MPVDHLHASYTERVSQWERCRDAFAGSDVVKSKGAAYLPRLGNQQESDYRAYVKRASWYGATARTVLGLTGSVMRKPASVEVPEVLATHFEDITRTNVALDTFAGMLVQEILKVGRAGILLDMPMVPGSQVRPHWVQYCAEQIVNWREEVLDGVKTLVMVVLKEAYEVPGKDEFTYECLTQYRVLKLSGGIYLVDLWRPDAERNGDYVLAHSTTPSVRGAVIPYIPFVFLNPLNLDPTTDKPPLLDLVDLNLAHYMNSADLEHGRHFTALPTPYVTGFAKDKQTSLQIGSSTAWVIPQAEARVGMLEFTGQGLQALEHALESKEKQMAVLGARMLEEQKMQTEASETHAIRRSGESSLLASIAETLSMGLTQVAKWHALWVSAREVDTLKIDLNKDFFGIPLSPSEVAELVRTWQAGGISYETLYYNLAQGEITRPGVTAEEEQSQIESETPTMDLGNRTDQDPEVPEGTELGPDGKPIQKVAVPAQAGAARGA